MATIYTEEEGKLKLETPQVTLYSIEQIQESLYQAKDQLRIKQEEVVKAQEKIDHLEELLLKCQELNIENKVEVSEISLPLPSVDLIK